MLTLTKLKGAEYLLTAVAEGLEDYYMGIGEAPGVWHGRWAATLDLQGVVEAEHLRALVNGLDHRSGEDLLAGHRERKVAAIDATLSAPKSASLLWAFGSEQVSTTVALAVVEATEVALGFLEDHAALARRQHGGIRRQVGTDGFAVATFAHRTSRLGDPQLHTHCLIPNLVRRDDGVYVAFDANPIHIWAKAAGTVFQNHLQRILTKSLGVAWGPERNGTREMVGFSEEQLRAFSKRTSAIEARLEAEGELAFDSPAERMRADDRASLATRPDKDKALTPERLRQRWATQAAEVGLVPGSGVDDLVVAGRISLLDVPDDAEVFEALVDPTTGLCALQSRFCEAQVVERIAAMSAGAMDTTEIAAMAKEFVASEAVVRLVPDAARRRPPEWSTVELRAVEDRLLGHLASLVTSPGAAVDQALIEAAIASSPKTLGDDQAEAVAVLCGNGPAVRLLIAPAGYGKTTALSAAVSAAQAAGRLVVVVAPTHKAVAELRAAGMEAQTLARLRRHLGEGRLAPATTVVVDEVSQFATRDAAVLMESLAGCPGAQLWCIGDARQAQSVAAGGLVVELEALASRGDIAATTLSVNRRQAHPAERAALAAFRAGDVEASQAISADSRAGISTPIGGRTRSGECVPPTRGLRLRGGRLGGGPGSRCAC